MVRRLSPVFADLVLFYASLFAQVPANLAPFSTFLKANSSVQQVATDAQGYIYVFGELTQFRQGVFVARLNPSAAEATYLTILESPGLTGITVASAMAVDAAGNAYVTGYTDASDFPTVPAGPERAPSDALLPFAAKLNANGAIVYSTLFSNGVIATPEAIVVDAQGNAIISGLSGQGFPSTPGAYNNSACDGSCPFVSKLDPTGAKLVFSAIGVGGSSLALDAAGDIYMAGSAGAFDVTAPVYPTTPGAFQTTYTPYFCYPNAFITIGSFEIPAGEQYVTKLSGDGSRLLYSTFVTGSRGAYNAGMAADASGNVWLTGATVSPDYPYIPALAAPSTSQTFTTELDPTGSKVLLSVPVGVSPGNGSNLAFDPEGDLIAVGAFPIPVTDTSPANAVPAPAPPSIEDVPARCLPGSAPYILRISSQDGGIVGTQVLLWGSSGDLSSTVDSQGNIHVGGTGGPNIPLTPGVFYDSSVTKQGVSGAVLGRTSFSAPVSPIGCVADAANSMLLGPIAPGQLITLYGNGIGPTQPVNGLVAGETSVPTALAGVSVTFDGQAAPILYASSTQVNVQAPFEVKQKSSTVMQASYNGQVLETRMFAVVPQNPGLFANSIPSAITCAETQIAATSFVATAINEDGSMNSCENPASAGSLLSLFVNGIGSSAANQTTGSFTISSPEFDPGWAEVSFRYVNRETGLTDANIEVGLTDQPNAISGIGQVVARVPQAINSIQAVNVTMYLGAPLLYSGITVAPQQAVVWVAPASHRMCGRAELPVSEITESISNRDHNDFPAGSSDEPFYIVRVACENHGF